MGTRRITLAEVLEGLERVDAEMRELSRTGAKGDAAHRHLMALTARQDAYRRLAARFMRGAETRVYVGRTFAGTLRRRWWEDGVVARPKAHGHHSRRFTGEDAASAKRKATRWLRMVRAGAMGNAEARQAYYAVQRERD